MFRLHAVQNLKQSDQHFSVADSGFGGRGGVKFDIQGRRPCPRHEVPSGGMGQGGGCAPF